MLFPAFTAAAVVSLAHAAACEGDGTGEFLFTGSNESGGEFGETKLPGVLGTDYIWPDTSAINRAVPDELTGSINETYFSGLEEVVKHITDQYYDNIITNVDGFGSFWTTIAKRFADNELVIFDTNNEYHDMENSLVAQLNQAAIDAIRAAGATSQYIFVEGNSYTGAWTWVSSGNGDALKDLTDPQNKIVYEMHQYLDTDGSGTSEDCVSTTIGVERLEAATAWLKANGKLGILGETAGGANDQCITAIRGELQHLLDNSDVWTGWLWWAAGPWWGDYMYSMEPPSGTAYVKYLSEIQEFIEA
ncbi:hypothetical protein G7Z17_g6912 [Cylindrodendrum hubeiense]|uniref:cellulase n=1 Tax=Cylindrodendrum hubeiense TaxID=595255 RepID=A0A9P5LGA4_9HYPO|nr:hypothetical protein G7Z17_g6912 [Cylindrodendrum hubeiense]